ncbi:MAG TPA: hypothetical protein ENK85_03560 [Saprospiraceae bacterium]|nr:hypothetical protein [Saprospiraceae bacterium]
MGNIYLLRQSPLIFILFLQCAVLSAQTNAFKWSFKKFDKDSSGEITFRELKCDGFFKFDRNNNLKLSRFEFWRLKRYQKRELRRFEKILRKGLYAKYYKVALTPLIAYKPAKDTYKELYRFKK